MGPLARHQQPPITREAQVRVGFDFSRLREIKLHSLLIRFGFGVAASVVAGTVTVLFGDRVGGLFLAFPAILPASLTLIDKEEGRQKAEVDAAGATIGALALVSFALVARELVTRTPMITTGLAAFAAWLLTGLTLYGIATRAVRRRR
jgi:hypothetical protein